MYAHDRLGDPGLVPIGCCAMDEPRQWQADVTFSCRVVADSATDAIVKTRAKFWRGEQADVIMTEVHAVEVASQPTALEAS